MKLCLILAALLAVAVAEPFYGGLGYGYGYDIHHGSGVSSVRRSGLGYGGYGYGWGRKKREADADAEPEADANADAEADADAYYGYGGYYGGQYGWPAAYGPGFASMCFGCRGKREAEADALMPGYGRHPTGVSYRGRTIYGYRPWVFGRRKREADAEPYYGIGYGYGYGRGYGGIAGHAGGGVSYRGRTIYGLRGKRSAEPIFPGWGYRYNARSGASFIQRSGVGYWPGSNTPGI